MTVTSIVCFYNDKMELLLFYHILDLINLRITHQRSFDVFIFFLLTSLGPRDMTDQDERMFHDRERLLENKLNSVIKWSSYIWTMDKDAVKILRSIYGSLTHPVILYKSQTS